ncbi:aldo/keto reductase [Streptomyces sp. SP17BM10]|uniref:aldo/keto reductase n=1 Tax=Streptomyces sp. SP17BM10 TaxID=3002530 RepID=UPI002E77E030|nr:aldo/keto reductase [Streptomyces sp. SP17BM10]MEE1786964.1 aldo/keto reductase [Streptomyces sp. SP17BM10]
MTAELALGTYRCRDVPAAVRMAVAQGAAWVDTAPNYAGGLAETLLSTALSELPALKVSTKVGYIPAGAMHDGVRAGALSAEEAERGHSLSSAYIAWQVARSRHALGRAPDLVFLHNPEHGLVDTDLGDRLYQAFATLEAACDRHGIPGYGISTWTGFARKTFDLPTLLETATRVGGRQHRFRAVQLPVSVVHLAPIAQALDGYGVLVDAQEAGIQVFASAPLHGGEVPDMIHSELAALIWPGAGAAQAALAVAASAPGVNRVLLSTNNTEHWAQAAAAVGRPPLPPDVLRRVVDVLGT